MNPPAHDQTSSMDHSKGKGLLTLPFIALLTTEILSNLGQTCLVFALPLHLLNISGSASLYGMVSALAVLPSILLTPWAEPWPTGYTSSPPWRCWTFCQH
ncbi:hypothetical protein BA20089_03795 [Bifidobacterium asteroides DSM 20089]|uniref:Uncharacterized protein n=1 Tax=Bifidobacterium asteroides DSM 20089 TaxID=1437594 RepID=A0AAD0AAV4_9BIFI|nr:hypothetical protein BA20089_03795 [Bifidobacterium asteroides DSM 20089]